MQGQHLYHFNSWPHSHGGGGDYLDFHLGLGHRPEISMPLRHVQALITELLLVSQDLTQSEDTEILLLAKALRKRERQMTPAWRRARRKEIRFQCRVSLDPAIHSYIVWYQKQNLGFLRLSLYSERATPFWMFTGELNQFFGMNPRLGVRLPLQQNKALVRHLIHHNIREPDMTVLQLQDLARHARFMESEGTTT